MFLDQSFWDSKVAKIKANTKDDEDEKKRKIDAFMQCKTERNNDLAGDGQ